MSERTKKFSEQLDRLIEEGEVLHIAMQYECLGEGFESQLSKALDVDNEKTKAFLAKLPDFRNGYQQWYSEAQQLVKQTLPDRLDDFVSHYEYRKARKEISFGNYMIRDYLQGLRVTRGYDERVVVDRTAALPEFVQQLNIVKAARATLDSVLMNLKLLLQADLFDTELDSARALSKAGYRRAAGAVCGVVIEKHLAQVCDAHGLVVRKKNPGISDLSQLLRDLNITTIPDWRFIQHLADIRNICDHAKGREPTKAEIDDLVAGAAKVLKTVF